MARDETERGGDLRSPRPQTPSSVPARKPSSTAPEGHRGDTVGRTRRGPTELPTQFGRYRVKKKLGGGGMGSVYLVENTELEREEALKVPHFVEGDDPQLRERFLREAKSAARLDHPNLCSVYDAGVLDGVYFLTMRFLKGKPLSDFTGKPQPPRKAAEIVVALAQALAAAHAKGVIHRDLKPSNVMLVAEVGPVVMDFGLAKNVDADKKLTSAGSMLGTPAYMPPEQVNGDLERMGPASDVYSLGVILYELLTGRLPFEGSMAAILGQIVYAEPPSPSALLPGLTPDLDEICRKALAKEPAARYPSMEAFAAALSGLLRAARAEGAADPALAAGDKAAGLRASTQTLAPPAGATVTPRGVRGTPVATKRSRKSRRSRAAAKRSMNRWLGIGVGVVVVLLGIVAPLAFRAPRAKTPAVAIEANAPKPDARERVKPGPSAPSIEPILGEDRLVGRWESVDAPIEVTQVFSKDGHSRITFSGVTTEGTYTLNGNDIFWKSAAMSAKVKVKFFSTTEMELSNESGQKVRYKKIGV
jgi:predicted Ser/Thr protein kinase